jgi:hypothetical protein
MIVNLMHLKRYPSKRKIPHMLEVNPRAIVQLEE